MTYETTQYPLCWPPGRPRTPDHKRERGNFGISHGKMTPGRVTQELLREIVDRLAGREVVISTNIELRNDGLPYANRRPVSDTGVAVYFKYKGKPMCFACDRWASVHENMWAITKTIDALRGVSRWGTGDMMQAAFTGFTALPAPTAWWQTLGLLGPDASETDIKTAHRRLSMQHHPDRGGSKDKMAEINRARDLGLEAAR